MTVVTGVRIGQINAGERHPVPPLAKPYRSREEPGLHKSISGSELVDKVIRIDQSPIVRTAALSNRRDIRIRDARQIRESASCGRATMGGLSMRMTLSTSSEPLIDLCRRALP